MYIIIFVDINNEFFFFFLYKNKPILIKIMLILFLTEYNLVKK